MKPEILILLAVIMLTIRRVRTASCDYMAKSRAAGTYEPATVKIKAFDGSVDSGSSSPITKEIPFCLIKDGEQCFPNNYVVLLGPQVNELANLNSHMKVHFPNSKNQMFGIGELIREADVGVNTRSSRTFRSFSCKSGWCDENILSYVPDLERQKTGTCQPCATATCPKDDTIDLYDFLESENQERYKLSYKQWIGEKKRKYENDLETSIADVLDCGYVSRENKKKKKDKNRPPAFTPIRLVKAARIEFKKGGGEFRIGICTKFEGETCFPNTKEEFMALKKHLETAKVLPEFKFKEIDENPENDSSTPAMKLKSWNCDSGICNSENLKCQRRNFDNSRVSRVWKVYEYQTYSKGVGIPSFTRLVLAINLIVFLSLA